MSPDHPQWSEFLNALAGPEFCDFQQNGWNCLGTHRAAKRLLERFDVDVQGSLAYFEEHGGFCDCEILFNLGMPTLEERLSSL
jgi:hypothetical protein